MKILKTLKEMLYGKIEWILDNLSDDFDIDDLQDYEIMDGSVGSTYPELTPKNLELYQDVFSAAWTKFVLAVNVMVYQKTKGCNGVQGNYEFLASLSIDNPLMADIAMLYKYFVIEHDRYKFNRSHAMITKLIEILPQIPQSL